MFQSSPTPKGGRYNNELMKAILSAVFQSSPTPKGGRYRYPRPRERHPAGVSILAHPERWALPTTESERGQLSLFQSSPTPKGGRYGVGLCLYYTDEKFQSSPTPKGGRYACVGCARTRNRCFNPRPPRKVGATLASDVHAPETGVSILAHPERWALPDLVRTALHDVIVSILAHPERWALRGNLYVGQCGIGSFNPRPPRKVGATFL